MATRNKKEASEKKRRVKVGKLEMSKKLSAAEKKGVRGGDKAGGKVQVHEITVVKTTDAASTKLLN